MSVAATQGAIAPVVDKKQTWSGTIQTIFIILAIGFVTIGGIKATHKQTPIKNAIARLVSWLPFLAPFVLLDDGPAISEGPCECECLPDGTAKAVVDGVKVDALNHEFGS